MQGIDKAVQFRTFGTIALSRTPCSELQAGSGVGYYMRRKAYIP